VEIGDWMDQSYAPTSGVDLTGLEPHADRRGKNRVAVGWAVPFSTKLGANCEYLVVESLKLKAYVVAKFVVRFFLRIPKGVKGPAWM